MKLQLKPVFEKRLEHWSMHHLLARFALRARLDQVKIGMDPPRASDDWDDSEWIDPTICEPDVRLLDEAQAIGGVHQSHAPCVQLAR